MKMKALIGGALVALVLATAPVRAANIPLVTGAQDPSQLNATINALINQINSLVTPATMGAPNSPRNLLDNGGMSVQQRGTGIQTCAQTSAAASANYGPDRWVCDANVTSGAGRQQVVTSSPSPMTGFTASNKLYRTSGALTQPVCVMQAIPTEQATSVAGGTVSLSFYAQALAGLNADNGSVISANIITGTTASEGFASWTASPAVTPAWTGLATAGTSTFTLTTAWARYTLPAISIGASVNEIAVQLCFTPTATGAGVTDGFAFVGVQLEAGNSVSAYEFRPYALEVLNAYRFYRQWNEAASGVSMAGLCQATGATAGKCSIELTPAMRAIPVMSLSAGTIAVNIAGTPTTLTSPTAATSDPSSCNFTHGNTNTAGQVELIVGAAGTGYLACSADY